jgi:hypothetical protein
MAQPFDAQALRLGGEALPIAGQVANPRAWSLGHFSVSQTGLLAYDTGGNDAYPIVWLNEKGQRIETVAEPPGPRGLVHSSLARRQNPGGIGPGPANGEHRHLAG